MNRAFTPFAFAALFLSPLLASADVTGLKIAKDEWVTLGGKSVHHLAGVVQGVARKNEPQLPTLDHVAGLVYESDFDIWFPAEINGRFWFSVLNRGNESGGIRDAVLARGGIYASCAWQAKNVAPTKPQLRLSHFEEPMPQAYGLLVIRDFVDFLHRAPSTDALPNPLAGKIRFTFATGISQSGRLMRAFLLCALNTTDQGRVFDGFFAIGARAGYLDVFRPDSDPGSGGSFSASTVYPPYAWQDLIARSGSDPKVFALNAESEYYEMMAYMSRRGPVPDNVRLYEFPLGGHGGGGTVPFSICFAPLSRALEQWVCEGTTPPESRMLALQASDNPRVKHLPGESVECPVLDDLGIAQGGVRLPPVDAPIDRFLPKPKGGYSTQPLSKEELTARYGTPQAYRKRVIEALDRLIHDRLLPESARAKYLAEAEKVSW